MKLKIRRSQKKAVMGKAVFILDVRVGLEDDESELVRKYQLQKQVVYENATAAQNLNSAQSGNVAALGGLLMDRMLKRRFTIGDLIGGQHLECKDLAEVIAAEHQVGEACQNVANYLSVAKNFDGSEVIVDIVADL